MCARVCVCVCVCVYVCVCVRPHAFDISCHLQDAGGNFAVGNCTSILVSVSRYPVDPILYPNSDFVLSPPVAAINGVAYFPSIMLPIAAPFIQLAFTCTQTGVSWAPAFSHQFSVGPSLAVSNCLDDGTISATSCGPPEFRSANLVVESAPTSGEVGRVLGYGTLVPVVVQTRDNDGDDLIVPVHDLSSVEYEHFFP